MRGTQNADRDASILADYARGISARDLMEEHGLSRQGIYAIIRKQHAFNSSASHRRMVNSRLRSGGPVPILELPLPWRTIRALEGAGVENSKQLFAAKEHHLIKIPDCGLVCKTQVEKLAKKYGHEIEIVPLEEWGTPAPWEKGK